MTSFETVFATPIAWVADQLATVPAEPGRRAVVLVTAERQAHAVRRHVCVDLAHPAHLAGVLFLRPVEFARELLVRAGSARALGWEDVRRLRILQLFESATLRDALRYFSAEQLRSGQGYVDAFARTIADLEASGLDAALARTVAQHLARNDRAAADRLHDVAVTWEAADAEAGALATTAQLLAAASALSRTRPELAAAFGPIFAVLAASPSTMLLRFLRALPACRAVFQDARPIRTGTQRWRALIGPQTPTPRRGASQLAAADSELRLVQRFLFELPEILTDPQRPRSAGVDGTVDIEEYPSVEDEIEAAATWVTEQIAAGIPAEQIALVVADLEPYAALLADRLQRVAPPGSDDSVGVCVAGGLPLAAAPAGMRVQGLLHALARGLEAEATIRILPALRRADQTNDESTERLSPSRAAELVYTAGIVGGSPGDRAGLREWMPRLQRRHDRMRQLAAVPDSAAGATPTDADEPEKRGDTRVRKDAARWLNDVEPLLPAIAALQQLAETVSGGATLESIWPRLRAFCERWLRVPPDPPTLLVTLERRLKPILADPVAHAIGGPAALRLLMDLLHSERRPTARFGEPCVFIGTASHAAGLPFAAVRVLGLAEGALPHTPHDDPIVPDNLRKHIEDAARAQQKEPDIVVSRLADHVLDDIHDVFRVVSGTGHRLALSAPRQWVDRSEREVSGILLEAATALGRTVQRQEEEGDVPTAARLRAAYLNPGRVSRMRAARDAPLSPRALFAAALAPAGSVGEAPHAATYAVPARWTDAGPLAVDQVWQLAHTLNGDPLSSLDGIVSDAWTLLPPGLAPKRPISQSALTMLLGCPHRFLQERILYLTPPASRPSTDVISPIDYGSLFHLAADRFFREAGPALCRRQGSVDQWVACARAIAGEEFDRSRDQYPMRGEDGIARERNRLLRQIEQLVHYEWQLPPREFLESELSFGDPEAVRLAVDDGELYVWGAIDRVDRLGAAALSVRDLKTGRVRDFGEDPVNAARDLQIGVYVLALEASGYGGAPVGVAAYVHPSAAQEPDRAFVGADVELLRQHTREWLAIARQLLRTGSFPRTPNIEDCAYCPFVPACGDGAQRRSAAKLDRLPGTHVIEPFARFKRKRSEDDQ